MDAADGEIYRKHAEDLTRFAIGLVGPGDAADVVSEVVLSCFNSEKCSTVTAKRSYLYRSVYNKAAEFHRSSRRRRRREALAIERELVEPPEILPEVLAAVMALVSDSGP